MTQGTGAGARPARVHSRCAAVGHRVRRGESSRPLAGARSDSSGRPGRTCRPPRLRAVCGVPLANASTRRTTGPARPRRSCRAGPAACRPRHPLPSSLARRPPPPLRRHPFRCSQLRRGSTFARETADGVSRPSSTASRHHVVQLRIRDARLPGAKRGAPARRTAPLEAPTSHRDSQLHRSAPRARRSSSGADPRRGPRIRALRTPRRPPDSRASSLAERLPGYRSRQGGPWPRQQVPPLSHAPVQTRFSMSTRTPRSIGTGCQCSARYRKCP